MFDAIFHLKATVERRRKLSGSIRATREAPDSRAP
jgi:hypothetical protein